MAIATPAQQTAIIDLYIALFNRAPDADGFVFWTQALANGASLTTVTGAFFVSPESSAAYPASQTASQFVSAFYQTVFGRTADAEGLAFWTGVLDSAGGIDSEAAKALLVSKIVDIVSTPLAEKPAGLSDEQYAETIRDRSTFTRKHAAATDFVEQNGTDVEAAGQALIEAVAPAPTPTPTPVGQTYTLTTGTDAFDGKGGDDIFNAPQVITDIEQNLSSTQTLNNEDVLDGGAGTDVLNAQLFISSSVKPTLKNIETVRVSVGSSNAGLDLAASTGFLDVGFDSGVSDGTLYAVGNARLSVSNQNAAAHFNGSTATALSLTLSNVGILPELFSLMGISATTVDLAYNGVGALATTHNIVITDSRVRITESAESAAVVSVNVAATGNNFLQLSEADAATVETLVVTGTGRVDFGYETLTALTDFTATGGGVQLRTDNRTANVLTIDTGVGEGEDSIDVNGASIKSLNVNAGNDEVYVYGALSAGAVVLLGAGDDVIQLEGGSAQGAMVDGGDGDDVIETGLVRPATGVITAVREVANMQVWHNLLLNETYTVAGLTFTASDGDLMAADLLAAFANLEDGAITGAGAGVGTYSGELSGYATGPVGFQTVTFTATDAGAKEDLVPLLVGSIIASPILVLTQGVSAEAATAGSVDTLTGGAGADTFVFTTPIVGTTAGEVTAVITDFTTGVDKIEVFSDGTSYAGTSSTFIKAQDVSSSLENLLAEATSALSGGKLYYVGQFGQDSYLVTDYETGGYTNVIKLENVALVGIDQTDLIGTDVFAPPPP